MHPIVCACCGQSFQPDPCQLNSELAFSKLQQASAIADTQCQLAAVSCEPPLFDPLVHFDLLTQASVVFHDSTELGGSELCACLLGFDQFRLFPQSLCQLIASHLDCRHMSGFDCCAQLESCEGCHVLFLSKLLKHRQVCFRSARMDNLSPSNLNGH